MHGWASCDFLYTCDPQPSESYGTCGGAGAHPSREVGSGAIGHVAAPEPSSAGRRGPELLDTWRRRSPPEQGGGVWSYRTHGGSGALLSWKVGFGAAGHVTTLEHSSTGRWGLELQDTWQHVVAHHAPCLDLKPMCGGTDSGP
jgi:hypothetical protein